MLRRRDFGAYHIFSMIFRLVAGLLVTALVYGCGESRMGDDQKPSGKVEAYEPRTVGQVTFSKDIATIMFKHCAVCHRPGASAPFNLLSYEDAKKRAAQIVRVTQKGFMPPWLPEAGEVSFIGERRLSTDELGLLAQWGDEGAVEGDVADLPPRPQWPQGWQLGEPDLVLRLDKPFTLCSEGKDVYRNFVFSANLEKTRYVKAVELRPGNPKIVHHGVLRIDQTRASRHMDQQDPAPGFDGMVTGGATNPSGLFVGWTPGKTPHVERSDLAWPLEDGSDLVLQLHLLPTGKPEIIKPSIGLFFSDTPPTRAAFSIRLGPLTIDIPAGQSDYVIEDSFVLPVPVEVLSVYPHAHYLGKEMVGLAKLPDGITRRLVHIRKWDFNWQDEYRFSHPIRLPMGTTLVMRYTYDNSKKNTFNPNKPPKRVLWGYRSSDEMGDLLVRVLPRDRCDIAALEDAFVPKEIAANISGYRRLLQINPDDAMAHFNLASLYRMTGNMKEAVMHSEALVRITPEYAEAHHNLAVILHQVGQMDRALAHYQHTLRLKPDFADAFYNLGNALRSMRKLNDAVEQYRKALRLRPDFAAAHNNLGAVLQEQENADEALEHYRAALRIDPESADGHNNLANALASAGHLADAIGHYYKALRLNPDFAAAHANLGSALMTSGKIDDAIRSYRRAIGLQPNNGNAHNNLGMALESLRRYDEAITHYQEAAERLPQIVSIRIRLAAAYAVTGQVDRAVKTMDQAIGLATANGNIEQVEELNRRRELYRTP